MLKLASCLSSLPPSPPPATTLRPAAGAAATGRSRPEILVGEALPPPAATATAAASAAAAVVAPRSLARAAGEEGRAGATAAAAAGSLATFQSSAIAHSQRPSCETSKPPSLYSRAWCRITRGYSSRCRRRRSERGRKQKGTGHLQKCSLIGGRKDGIAVARN